MKFLFFFYCLFTIHSASPQVSISGRILNGSGSEPVSKASVYINNSTIGTASAENGDYILNGINPGVYEIIVSHIGYDLVVYKIEVKKEALKLSFQLESRVKVMRDILVVTSNQRARWMAILKDNFLGQTIAAENSRILNEDDIFFEKGLTKNEIKAFSEVPLIIENKELGYRVYFELQEFYYNMAEERTLFYGFSRYEELRSSDKLPLRKFIRNRERTYLGSTLHFYHALLESKLEKEGFSTFLSKTADTGNAKRVKDPAGSGDNPGAQISSPQVAISVSGKDILFHDSTDYNSMYLNWKGTLNVRYRYNPYYKEDLKKKVMVAGNLPQGFQSGIVMLEAPAYLDPNGILINPLAVQYSGFWSYEKLANMLPINYKPE